MPATPDLNHRPPHSRRGAAAAEMAIVMPAFVLMILGCIDCGRFVNSSIAVANAARAGAGVGMTSQYPDAGPTAGTTLSNWQMSICAGVANELGMGTDFAPAGSADPNGFTNAQGLYVQATCASETGGPWGGQVTVRYPFSWWSVPNSAQPQQSVVFRAIR